MVLGELRGPGRAQRLRYRRFVEEGLLREIENPFEAVRWQAVLGDESLVQKLRDRVKGLQKQRREITSLRRALPSVDPQKILQRVAKKCRVVRINCPENISCFLYALVLLLCRCLLSRSARKPLKIPSCDVNSSRLGRFTECRPNDKRTRARRIRLVSQGQGFTQNVCSRKDFSSRRKKAIRAVLKAF